ncbi:hypothetical protein I7I53_07445 [Histoplasma capsulatum var. duboisii H88]|uniref:Uncharacterized protein n=1 Tax=Ajellomyces capsulatus (strain H88) TaxID=544711 RepID=A0A8A1LH42_AJEC8|nr:hypothetical protein I7I53_07445 [Histoplasma capsulatum var. duboisii H88]
MFFSAHATPASLPTPTPNRVQILAIIYFLQSEKRNWPGQNGNWNEGQSQRGSRSPCAPCSFNTPWSDGLRPWLTIVRHILFYTTLGLEH